MRSLIRPIALSLAVPILFGPALAEEPSPISRAIFDNDRKLLPVGLVALADGSLVALKYVNGSDAARDQYLAQRIGPLGNVVWTLPLSARTDPPAAGPAWETANIAYTDESSLFDLWKIGNFDDDVLDQHLVFDRNAGDVVAADSILGLWRFDLDGRLKWHRHLFEPLGLALLTSLAATSDGALLLGGLSASVGIGGCAAASVVKVDARGRPEWRWLSSYDKVAYATALIPLANGTTVVSLENALANRYFSALGNSPCGAPVRYPDWWLIWLDDSGAVVRERAMPKDMSPLGLVRLADDRVGLLAWQTWKHRLILQVMTADGEDVVFKRFDVHRLFGWSTEISPWFNLEVGATADRIAYMGWFECYLQIVPCEGRGGWVIEIAADGRLRRMPRPLTTFPFVKTVLPDATALMIVDRTSVTFVPGEQPKDESPHR